MLDVTTTIFGPYTTQILGNFGADVIKIEARGGDVTRDIGPKRNANMGALFLGVNRNKRSIVIDLKTNIGKAALWRLIETADVFVHNMRAQKVIDLGFGPEAVQARKADIIYAGLHGFLSDGSYASKPAYDDAVQGLSGIAGAFATRDGDPKLIPSVISDKNAVWVAAAVILSAVISWFRTGKGCYFQTGMFEAMSAWNLVEHLHGETFTPPLSNMGYPRMMTSDRRPHRTKDGYLCLLAYTDRQWRKFWSLTNKPENAKDPRFATMADRSRHIGELYAAAGDELVTRTSSEWLSLLDEADIPAGPVNSFDDLVRIHISMR